jgi:hypothetical protein
MILYILSRDRRFLVSHTPDRRQMGAILVVTRHGRPAHARRHGANSFVREAISWSRQAGLNDRYPSVEKSRTSTSIIIEKRIESRRWHWRALANGSGRRVFYRGKVKFCAGALSAEKCRARAEKKPPILWLEAKKPRFIRGFERQIQDGNGEFPVGDWPTISVPAGENFPVPVKAIGAHFSISHPRSPRGIGPRWGSPYPTLTKTESRDASTVLCLETAWPHCTATAWVAIVASQSQRRRVPSYWSPRVAVSRSHTHGLPVAGRGLAGVAAGRWPPGHLAVQPMLLAGCWGLGSHLGDSGIWEWE